MTLPSFVTSSLLPVPHGFSTREGGVSEGPYASLNLGFAVGDARERVEENHRRLAQAAGAALGALGRVSQVHGDRVLEARGRPDDGGLRPVLGEADALWTEEEGGWVAVGTADCVPVLLVDPDGRRVAAVHSGWRGTDADISARVVEVLVARGARPDRLLAAVGPCIQRCCYEVSPELAERFTRRFGPDVVTPHATHPHLDLPFAVRRTLLTAGLLSAHVDVLQACTACDAARFFSHRRDAGRTGRHLNFVVRRF
ncbi:peptidoglycan editing factor PgeF [Corallococcus sp. H22C18031201]|uniref:peptidoglycan editing factor PgeF n=1 Tax=Citreicoccus inhibens TaxID=2849499 RepID=UPI000E7544FF|nr:peptidoglycan editing factor PgeF [Citreicoccus inhibens]MBU8900469.1 peptidoglycan editing factor PgeF [Citreicoccus inhibens]RJS20728.1 peptidoglycan editing factor PgeF [Corallococcus sp. H22C18031201]